MDTLTTQGIEILEALVVILWLVSLVVILLFEREPYEDEENE